MRVEDLQDTLGRLRDWIDNADTKTSVLIAVLAILLAFTLPEIKDTKDLLQRSGFTVLNDVFIGVWIVYLTYLFLSLFHALHELTPHEEWLELKTINDRPIVTDFSGIASLSLDEYSAAVRETDEEQLREELIRLCYRYGQSVRHKFQHYLIAMFEFRVALFAQVVIFVWLTIVLPAGV